MSLHSIPTGPIWLCVLPMLAAHVAIDRVRTTQSECDLEAASLARNFDTAIGHYLIARIGARHMLALS
jgi:hypothetical protein